MNIPANERIKTMGKVIIVNGPAGAGKTSYVKFYKNNEDTIIDIDAIRAALSLSDGMYSERSKSSIYFAVLIRDMILKEVDKIRLSGNNLYLIMTEPDKEKVMEYILKYNAEYILLEPEKEVCIEHIKNDERRINKKYFYKLIDDWYNFDKVKKEKEILSNDKIIEYCNNLMKEFNTMHIDYFISGSICACLSNNIDLKRPIGDIDIYITKKDMWKIKEYCKNQNIEFVSCEDNLNLLANTGHMYYFYPIEGYSFHIGFFIFERNKEGISICDYENHMGKMICKKNIFSDNSITGKLFSVNSHILPYEFPMTFKLAYGRYKDFNDYEKVCKNLNINLIEQIKNDYKNAKIETNSMK